MNKKTSNQTKPVGLTRREALIFFSTTGAAFLFACKNDPVSNNPNGNNCVVTPELTEGPFFVDERLNRSNIVESQNGLPLTLNINVYNANTAACTPISGVQVDVWHTNALGLYSDVQSSGTVGQTFLRGYQLTTQAGNVTFQTVYPGWYSGRTAHIHVKARIFNASGSEALDATTQVFFDDGITDAVYTSLPPYNTRGNRNTRNNQDSIYGGRTSLLLALSGSVTSGYTGNISIGIRA